MLASLLCMEYLCSTLQYRALPSEGVAPVEPVNVGVIVGQEGTSEWGIIPLPRGAAIDYSDEDNPQENFITDNAFEYVLDAVGRLRYHLDTHRIASHMNGSAGAYKLGLPPSALWLTRIFDPYRSTLKVSECVPLQADSLSDALHKAAHTDLKTTPEAIQNEIIRSETVLSVHSALADQSGVRSGNLYADVFLAAEPHHDCLDFAVIDGTQLQSLVCIWPFSSSTPEALSMRTLSWAWVMSRALSVGGTIVTNNYSQWALTEDTNITVVHAVPGYTDGAALLEEATKVCETLDVNHIAATQIHEANLS